MKNVDYNFYFLNLFFYFRMLARLLPSLYTRLRYNKRALSDVNAILYNGLCE